MPSRNQTDFVLLYKLVQVNLVNQMLSANLNVRQFPVADHLPDRPQMSPQVRRSVFDTEHTRTADRHNESGWFLKTFLERQGTPVLAEQGFLGFELLRTSAMTVQGWTVAVTLPV